MQPSFRPWAPRTVEDPSGHGASRGNISHQGSYKVAGFKHQPWYLPQTYESPQCIITSLEATDRASRAKTQTTTRSALEGCLADLRRLIRESWLTPRSATNVSACQDLASLVVEHNHITSLLGHGAMKGAKIIYAVASGLCLNMSSLAAATRI